MKERPIIFSSDTMVRAILDGRKTQTRRVINPQPVIIDAGYDDRMHWKGVGYSRHHGRVRQYMLENGPYQIGDSLWVRETWGAVSPYLDPCDLRECKIEYRADLPTGCTDYPGEWPAKEAKEDDTAPRWRPSIHMPRWASRITLEIINVRVERVQSITDKDCLKEGFSDNFDGNIFEPSGYHFKNTWDSINAKRGYGWDTNPWVWVIEFVRVDE